MTARDLKRKDIKAYAKGAIAELSDQLTRATTETKKTKLKNRIKDWEEKLK